MDIDSLNHDKIIELYQLLWDDFHKVSHEQFKTYKFSAHQAMALRELYKSPNMTLKELSERLNLSKSTVSELVNKLEVGGKLVKEVPEDNRRTVRLSLSPDFSKDFDFVYVKKGYLLDALKDTDPQELEKIIYGLEKFHTILERSIKSINKNEKEI